MLAAKRRTGRVTAARQFRRRPIKLAPPPPLVQLFASAAQHSRRRCSGAMVLANCVELAAATGSARARRRRPITRPQSLGERTHAAPMLPPFASFFSRRRCIWSPAGGPNQLELFRALPLRALQRERANNFLHSPAGRKQSIWRLERKRERAQLLIGAPLTWRAELIKLRAALKLLAL